MDAPHEGLSRSLFGLDGAEVDEVLRLQRAANAEHLQAMRQTLAAEQARLEQLLAQTEAMERRAAAQRTLGAQLEDALRQAGETAPLLDEAIAQRARLLEAQAEERHRLRRQEIADLNGIVQSKLRQLESAAEQICRLNPDESGSRSHVAGGLSATSDDRTDDRTDDLTENHTHDSQTSGENSGDDRPPPRAGDSASAPSPEAQLEAGLRGRINANMMRLLAGKVVGEDLRDPDNTTIATRGTPITEDIATRAQAAGVLPDLILHMTWPEETRP